MNLKLEDIILKEMSVVMKNMMKEMLFEDFGDVIGEYEPSKVTDQSKVIDFLLPYLDNQNLSLTMFSELINKDDITRNEQYIVFDIFKFLYPEKYNQIVYNILTTKKENIEEIKKELDSVASKLYDNLAKLIPNDEYVKQYIISYSISNIIKEITPGQKELNTQYKDYYFNNIFYKLFPNRQSDKETTKNYFKSSFDEAETDELLLIKGNNLSGWVIYIFGLNDEDSQEIINYVDDVVKSNGASLIASTNKYFSKSGGNVAVKIYIPYDIVKLGTQKEFFESIQNALNTYDPIGVIPKYKKYSENMYYGYIFKLPFTNLPQEGIPFDQMSQYMSIDTSNYMSGVIQPDLFSEKSELFNYYSQNITTFEDLNKFINQESNNISWDNMGYDSKDIESNKKDLLNKIKISIEKGHYLTIPKGGFEKFGINNFRDFVKNIK
jgi:hypothetical protein